MKSYFSRFLHHTLSHSDVKEVFTSSLSLSDLIGESRSNQVANLSNLDYRVKPDNDGFCTGRSMVEMLGVLAIVGVLSVGAIAGYSKAMFKYKLNKMVDQYNQLFGTIAIHREEFIKLSTKTQTYYLYELLKKMGELPDGMTTNGYSARDVFKHGSVLASEWGTNVLVHLDLVNKDEGHTSSAELIENCRNMYQYLIIPRQDDIDMVFFYYYDESGSGIEDRIYGNKYCTADSKCLKNLSITDIDVVCNSFRKNRGVELIVQF